MLKGIIPGLLREAKGEAFIPQAGGHRIVVHVVATTGEWPESTYFAALNKVWPRCKEEYRRWYFSQRQFKLGFLQEVNVSSDLTFVNILALDDKGKVDTASFTKAAKEVARLAKEYGSSVHVNKNDDLLKVLQEEVVNAGINVNIYDSLSEK